MGTSHTNDAPESDGSAADYTSMFFQDHALFGSDGFDIEGLAPSGEQISSFSCFPEQEAPTNVDLLTDEQEAEPIKGCHSPPDRHVFHLQRDEQHAEHPDSFVQSISLIDPALCNQDDRRPLDGFRALYGVVGDQAEHCLHHAVSSPYAPGQLLTNHLGYPGYGPPQCQHLFDPMHSVLSASDHQQSAAQHHEAMSHVACQPMMPQMDAILTTMESVQLHDHSPHNLVAADPPTDGVFIHSGLDVFLPPREQPVQDKGKGRDMSANVTRMPQVPPRGSRARGRKKATDDPQAQKQPARRGRRRNNLTDEQRRRKFLVRNRSAASRCRKKVECIKANDKVEYDIGTDMLHELYEHMEQLKLQRMEVLNLAAEHQQAGCESFFRL